MTGWKKSQKKRWCRCAISRERTRRLRCHPLSIFAVLLAALLLPPLASGQAPQREAEAAKEVAEKAQPSLPLPVAANNPYPDNPALKDLYRQFPERGGQAIERFGMSLFKNGTGNADKLPMDVPIGPDYVLGPGDGVVMDISGGAPQRLQAVVDPEGKVNLPEGGTLMVAGLSLSAAERAIEQALSRRYNNPKVTLALSRLRTIRIYVVGDVERPGAYDISSQSTVLNALYAAGGPTAAGSLRLVRHYRGEQLISTIDLYDLILRGVRTDVRRLESGDSILVPTAGTEVTVEGEVRRPARYELLREETLAEVLELAGGISPQGSLRQISIDRVEAHQRRVEQTLPVASDASPETVTRALAEFRVNDGDRVYVAPIRPYTEQSVYLYGHVFRAGPYAFHSGMKLTELIGSYSDLLPEPASRAEIIRLTGANRQPETIPFDIVNVLEGKEPAPELEAFDVVRIFGRYDLDAPMVSIQGEVLKPGAYPLESGMRVSDLVRGAGGFSRSAYREQALVASYRIEQGRKVEVEQQEVDLRAAAADGAAEPLLKANDVVFIRQIPGWKDIGASVTLSGEVRFPGVYGITPGERLSSVIRRAGGFLPVSYPQVAVLQRPQVRELNAQLRQQLIARIESTPSPMSRGDAKSDSDPARDFEQQKKEIVARLKSEQDPGRLVIHISRQLAEWENTANDPPLCAGDSLFVPREPGFVIVHGQVNNTNALVYVRGKTVAAYLRDAGGVTRYADARGIFVIHADGTVAGRRGGWLFGSLLDETAAPGDLIVVPDKIVVESQTWKDLLNNVEVFSSLVIAARVALSF
jgi:protein involved in polysaccharide export with SLBB domain